MFESMDFMTCISFYMAKASTLCWTSSKMEASDWLKYVCYKYLAATTTLFKRN